MDFRAPLGESERPFGWIWRVFRMNLTGHLGEFDGSLGWIWRDTWNLRIEGLFKPRNAFCAFPVNAKVSLQIHPSGPSNSPKCPVKFIRNTLQIHLRFLSNSPNKPYIPSDVDEFQGILRLVGISEWQALTLSEHYSNHLRTVYLKCVLTFRLWTCFMVIVSGIFK